jgi:hypothetical protein
MGHGILRLIKAGVLYRVQGSAAKLPIPLVSSCTTSPVYVRRNVLGAVKLNHPVHRGKIQAPRSNVRGEETRRFFLRGSGGVRQ